MIDEKFIHSINDQEFTFVFVYRKSKDNIVAYVKARDIILKYMALPSNETKLSLKKLSLRRKPKMIYNDAIAIEALQIIEEYKTMLLLVCDKQRHTPKN